MISKLAILNLALTETRPKDSLFLTAMEVFPIQPRHLPTNSQSPTVIKC